MASEDIFADHFTEEDEPDLEEHEIDEQDIEADEIMNDAEAEPETEETDEEHIEEAGQVISDESAAIQSKKPDVSKEKETKLLQLPLTRVRHLMKLDPDLHIASNEAVFIVARATELFIESFAREAFTYTTQGKKKTMQKRDIDLAIAGVDSLLFLDGALNF